MTRVLVIGDRDTVGTDIEGALADVDLRRFVPRRGHAMRVLVADAREALPAALASPLRALRLARRCRSAPGTKHAPVRACLRHLAFLRADADVVHFGSLRTAMAFPLVPWLLDASSVVTCSTAELDSAERANPRDATRFTRVLATADALICPSEAAADRCRLLSGRDRAVWVGTPRAHVDAGVASRLPRERRSGVRVVAHGALGAAGALDLVVGALALLRDEGTTVAVSVIGSGPLGSRLRWSLAELELDTTVTFAGDPAGAELDALLAEADVYVAAGVGGDAAPRIADALSAGVPVVVCEGGAGTGELVRDGVDGFVVTQADIPALADRVGRLARDADLRVTMSASARTRAAEEFSVVRAAGLLDDVYRSVCGPRGGRRDGAAPVRGTRVARYTTAFPKHPGQVRDTLAAIDAGVDLHVFAGEPSAYISRFPDVLERADLRERVHFLSHRERAPWGHRSALVDLVTTVARHPRAFFRFVAHNRRDRGPGSVSDWHALWYRFPFVGHHADVLHVESDTWALDVADLCNYFGCPVLLSSVTTLQRTPVSEVPDGYARIFAVADGYHFISQYLCDNTRSLGLRGVPTWVVERGVDTTMYTPPVRPARAADGPFRVLAVGRMFWEKGYEWALRAIAEVRAAGVPVSYTIVGDGPDEAELRHLARELGIDDVVRFLGEMPNDAVIAEYRRADVVAHAALEEGWGFAVSEAQAMGLPVVATHVGGLPENVEEAVTGFLVPPRDAHALADRLVRLARDPELGARMGAAARKRVLEQFELHHQAARFAEVYAELARSHAADGSGSA